ncbi:rod-determining factor RdfA [Natronorubrum thiooxidans]|uniref:Uncharacterized protein n=1 Tax=Natronorubrum thiooxidans TaxID=308853 RepID=A0A1N7GL62_9EURY|nr:rod-determining factor RdfA [Natronorubrum thiooxidans]SIS13290.1 hypothetical protein SAMN05421752_11324 [Natronorubrum thiooxidans]
MSNETGNCKIDRISQKWDLESLDERLLERREAGDSLRDLETYYNQQVLEAAMTAAGMEPLEGEVENLYQLLTGDNVGAGTKVEAQSRLKRNDVDPETITSDFVSYQTVRTHLNDCLNVETKRDTGIDETGAKNIVFKLLSRTESITKRTIERLRSSDRLAIGEPEVTLSLRVACKDCGEEYTFTRLVERGRCSCSHEDVSTDQTSDEYSND